MDRAIVRALNHWFSQVAWRADLDRFMSLAPLIAVIVLVILAWFADWGRAPQRRAILVIGILGALLALGINVAIGHFYFRPRPFLALPGIHPLLPRKADSSLYSDHVCIATALAMSLFLTRRRLGYVAALLAVLLALGRVGAGVHYPSDVIIGAVAGLVCLALVLPLRHAITNLIHAVATGERRLVPREGKEAPFLLRHGPFVTAAVLILVAALGYGARALPDIGRVAEANRIESFYRKIPDQAPPGEYPATSVPAIAAGSYTATHAAVVGDVTQVSRELDGDIHLRVEAGGAFLVAEIIPEFPIAPPHVGQRITAWGIVRHDGLHNWWELHPLIGWDPGDALSKQPPPEAPGAGD
jgi:undecaprenyl-diphosphatase